MQMVQMCGRGNPNAGVGEGSSRGGARRNEERVPSPPPPPPPPYTTEVSFVQFLGSQQNMEQMQQNMEAALCNIADNSHHGANQGGEEVNHCSSLRSLWNHSKLMNGLTLWSKRSVSFG